MDPAVALTQAYLRVNGYFTETEYPVVALKHGLPVTLTDLDILAIRFPNAERWIPSGQRGVTMPGDPLLAVPAEGMDMIIGEVKEGRGSLNASARSPEVLEAVLRRFGCCGHDPSKVVKAILEGRFSETRLTTGFQCRLRIIVFSGSGEPDPHNFQVIPLRHAAHYICNSFGDHDGLLSHTQFKDDALGFIALLHKLGCKL